MHTSGKIHDQQNLDDKSRIHKETIVNPRSRHVIHLTLHIVDSVSV